MSELTDLRATKLGTVVELPDGRVGTVVYNSLIGVGIKWGEHNPDPADFEGTDGNTVKDNIPDGFEWEPDALLRDPWGGCERCGFTEDQCVGTRFKVVKEGVSFG